MPFFRRDKTRKLITEVEVVRTKITLACTECQRRNYNMTKDKKTHPDRMETKKSVQSKGVMKWDRQKTLKRLQRQAGLTV